MSTTKVSPNLLEEVYMKSDDGVLSGTITGTYTLAGTPTITNPTITNPTITTPTITGGVASADPVVALGLATKQYIDYTVNAVPFPPKYIQGLTYANNGADATNDLDIAAGVCVDATGEESMVGTAKTKQSDVAWAVGSGTGMLDTGAVGNNDYYIWAIKRSDTGVVDYLSSLSSTAPTMPANYDFKRLIGWFKRVAGAIVLFNTYEADGGGIELYWASPTLEVDLTNTLTTTRRTDAMKVPLNFSTIAIINLQLADAVQNIVYVACPDTTDVAPSTTVAPLANAYSNATGSEDYYQLRIRTSAAGLIAARASVATMNTYRVSTVGFIWGRRN